MSYEYHQKALLKVHNKVYVPTCTSGENVETMVSHVIGSHWISFQEKQLPLEGVMPNCALYTTVKCRDSFLAQVLIDNGWGLNICPLSTLIQLDYEIGKICQNCVKVRAYDGAQRETIGEVDLCIQMGPIEFVIEFPVMGIARSYNL